MGGRARPVNTWLHPVGAALTCANVHFHLSRAVSLLSPKSSAFLFPFSKNETPKEKELRETTKGSIWLERGKAHRARGSRVCVEAQASGLRRDRSASDLCFSTKELCGLGQIT